MVPTITTFTPSRASVSLPPGTTPSPGPSQASELPTQKPLAFTGDDLQRDAEIGAALIAAGWAIKHWTAREET